MTSNTGDGYGVDLYAEIKRLRAQNAKLVTGIATASIGGLIALLIGFTAYFQKPDPDRYAVGPNGEAFPLQSLTKNDPPDSRVTRFASDCVTDLLNQKFDNYQSNVERAIGSCFTGGGSESIRTVLDPFLAKAKEMKMNLAVNFVIQPFINTRWVEGKGISAYRVYNIQAVVTLGYRGQVNSTRAVEYTLETNLVRVPYQSQIEGLRMQNLLLKVRS